MRDRIRDLGNAFPIYDLKMTSIQMQKGLNMLSDIQCLEGYTMTTEESLDRRIGCGSTF